MFPQVMSTNRCFARGLFSWMTRAICVFPVPLCPVRSTVLADRAAMATSRKTPAIASLRPMTLSSLSCVRSTRVGSSPSSRRSCSSRRSTTGARWRATSSTHSRWRNANDPPDLRPARYNTPRGGSLPMGTQSTASRRARYTLSRALKRGSSSAEGVQTVSPVATAAAMMPRERLARTSATWSGDRACAIDQRG